MKNRGEPQQMRGATWAFIREARRTPGYSLFDFLHAYVYARWPYLYVSIGTGEHPLARILKPPVRLLRWLLAIGAPPDASTGGTIADRYHGKVVPLAAATQLVTIREEVDLGDLEQIIPYPVARDLVLKNPDHIVALECPCRTARDKPCLPLDVCLIVGEPFASFVAEHHPRRSRWITAADAVSILQAEQERGHVSHAFFKDAMLARFYAICNCCSCCCAGMRAFQNGTPMLASSGYVAQVDAELCASCGLCAARCQFHAVSLDEGYAVIDAAACMGCGVCVSHCPQEAISLRRDPSRGEPLEIRELISHLSRS